jgi:hypothetical protein
VFAYQKSQYEFILRICKVGDEDNTWDWEVEKEVIIYSNKKMNDLPIWLQEIIEQMKCILGHIGYKEGF